MKLEYRMRAQCYTPTVNADTTPATTLGSAPHFCTPMILQGLLEPDAVRIARPDLRGPRRSNALGLSDNSPDVRKRLSALP